MKPDSTLLKPVSRTAGRTLLQRENIKSALSRMSIENVKTYIFLNSRNTCWEFHLDFGVADSRVSCPAIANCASANSRRPKCR